jgi:DNA glycosylase AlkZ-like
MSPARSTTDAGIARWRLGTQHLVAPFQRRSLDVVRDFLAVQAENVGQTAWAVACRTTTPDPADLDRLLETGAVIRTHVLRTTWHYVSAEDVGWLVELTGPRVQRTTGQALRKVHGLDARSLGRAQDTVVDVLASKSDLTRSELAAELTARGIRAASGDAGMFTMLLLTHTELSGLICSGPPRGGEHTYAVMAERVPAQRRLDKDEALGELARRYVLGHGPATERDLAYWASLTLGDARRGLDVASEHLATFDHDGRIYWHAAGASISTATKSEPRGHLLQILDEIYRGYQDSRWLLDAAGLVPRGRETQTGMALVDGQLVAAVRRTVRKDALVFDLKPYRSMRRADLDAVRTAARRYGDFLGLPAEVLSAPS